MLNAFGLPRGVAIIRVKTQTRTVVICSPRLSALEQRAARRIASARARQGLPAVVVREDDVYRELGAVA
jgi:hypothetical protein